MCIDGRDLTEPKLDPAGRRVAFVSRDDGRSTIVIVDLDDDGGATGAERHLDPEPAPSAGRGMGGGCLAWLPDGSAIVYAAADGGLWHQPVPGGSGTCLVTGDRARPAQAPVVAPNGSFVSYVVDQAEVWMAAVRPGPATDAPAPRRLDDGSHDFCLDPTVDPTSGVVAFQAWSVPDMPWDGAVTVSVEVASGRATTFAVADAAVQQPRFAPDGTLVTIHDGSGWLNVWWGDRAAVVGGDNHEHAGPTWGPGQATYAVSPDGRRVAIARNEDGFGRLVTVDVADGVVTEIARGVHGQLSWQGDHLVALRTGARTPTQVVRYGVATWARRVLAVGPVAGWDGVDLTEPTLMAVDHDGVTLSARVYRASRPTGRLLCWVHGGPTDQWTVSFMPRLAFWLGQGWDVLVVDHRGSTGHGRAFQQALHGRWGELDIADTATLLAHAHAHGLGTPTRTAMIGGSAGGLTVLGMLAHHPDLCAGGVASYPVTDLVELAARSHRFEAHYTDTLVGPSSQRALLRRRSPKQYAERVGGPLLLLHGTDDPVVPVESTIEFAGRMRRAGGDVEMHLFDGEGHGFRAREHQLAEYRLTATFLDRTVA